MTEIMYDKSSVLIAVILFVTMAVAIVIGNRVGRRLHNGVDDGIKSQVNAFQGSLLGILALLLGFTFSQSLQRYDVRSAAVVDETNAIGTIFLRTDLLPSQIGIHAQALRREYINTRIDAASVSLDRYE
jgi:hypothetical protein